VEREIEKKILRQNNLHDFNFHLSDFLLCQFPVNSSFSSDHKMITKIQTVEF
jgi:hypothetical protein